MRARSLPIFIFLVLSLVLSLTACSKFISSDIPDTQSGTASQWLADHQVESKDPEVVALATRITKGSNSDVDKMLAIHNWVATNIQYDHELYRPLGHDPTATQILNGYDDSTASKVLHSGKAICQGYSALTASLLIAVGIPAKVVIGTITNSNEPCSHVWNKAFVDGKWMILDTTWDAASNNSHCREDYLNPDPEFFALSHTECSESTGT